MTSTPTPEETESRHCPDCGEELRMAWIGNDPPEPYGEVCGCPDPDYADARDEKAAQDREALPAGLAALSQQDASK